MKSTSVNVRLSPDELAIVDEHRGARSRSAYVRALLRDAAPAVERDVASRDEALEILTALARDGKVAAAIALERALRAREDAGSGEEVPEWLR